MIRRNWQLMLVGLVLAGTVTFLALIFLGGQVSMRTGPLCDRDQASTPICQSFLADQ
jgi:hypothetical protein